MTNAEPTIETVSRGPTPVYDFDAARSRFAYGWADIRQAVAQPRLVVTLVRATFFNRYQNTALGAFWVTATTMLMVTCLAFLYGKLFGREMAVYYPYVAVGVVAWGLISTLINDGASVFILGANSFNQIPIAKSIFALRSVGLAYLTLVFRLAIIVFVLAIMKVQPSVVGVLLSLAGLAIIAWTGFWFSLLWGTLGLRYRDIGALTAAVMTISFLLTPVIWMPDRLGDYMWVVHYNPLYHYLHIVRGSLLGYDGVAESFAAAGAMSAAITVCGALIYGQFARRLSYWS